MTHWLSGVLVLAVGVFLLRQALAAWHCPIEARRFLSGFAATPVRQYTGMFLRILAGGAFIHFVPSMQHGRIFAVISLVILGTTLAVLLLPWRLHQRSARWAVPSATRRLGTYALGCALAGPFIINGLVMGSGDKADCCSSPREFAQ